MTLIRVIASDVTFGKNTNKYHWKKCRCFLHDIENLSVTDKLFFKNKTIYGICATTSVHYYKIENNHVIACKMKKQRLMNICGQSSTLQESTNF